MKRAVIYLQVGAGSGWSGRLVGLLLGMVAIAFVLLLIFGLWLALTAIIVLIVLAMLLRAFVPRHKHENVMKGKRSVESTNDSSTRRLQARDLHHEVGPNGTTDD